MSTILSPLLDFLLPTGCVACRSWVPQEPGSSASIVCRPCRLRLLRASWPRCPRCHAPRGTGRAEASDCLECRSWPPALRRARFARVLLPPATDLVHALKYEGWRELAGPLGSSMARTVRAHVPFDADGCGPPWLVVPVPTTEARIRTRGYNQAKLLASVVASQLGMPLREGLTRSAASASQTSLDPDARRANVRGAFAPSPSDDVGGARVLLVDDVLTTGATACEAACTLVAAGAASVSLVTFARALPRVAARREAGARAA